MRHLSTLTAAFIVASVAATGHAAVIGNVTRVAPPFMLASETALGNNYFFGFLLSIATDDGSLISAVDVRIVGPLHQRWIDTNDDGVFEPTPSVSTTSSLSGDSRLTPIAGALFSSAPTENNSGTGSPLADTATRDYGMGTSLAGAWGIPGVSQSTSANLAYIVVPDPEPYVGLLYSIQVEVATSNGTQLLNQLDFFRVAEPSSFVGGLLMTLLVACRRGRSFS